MIWRRVASGSNGLTPTTNEPSARLPAASTALQRTVVEPTGKVLPEAGEHVTGRLPPTASRAVAVKFTTAPEGDVASAVIDAGRLRTGGVVSATVIRNEPRATLPE